MDLKKEFLYFMKVKEKDGKVVEYPIYRQDEQYFIKDHKVPAGVGVEEEIKNKFDGEAIGPVMPHSIHDETKFKKPS